MAKRFHAGYWTKFLLAGNITLLLLLGASYPYLDRGTATYVIAQLSFVFIFLTMASVVVAMYFEWPPFSPNNE